MEMIYLQRRTELSSWFNSKGKNLLDKISSDLQDFELEMKWLYIFYPRSFNSIIPFVTHVCPSDTYKVYKRGGSFR
jgi:hypothetical protein